MKERLLRLLTVKSIVAILLTLVFAYLSVCGLVAADQFLTVFTVIIAFTLEPRRRRQIRTERADGAWCRGILARADEIKKGALRNPWIAQGAPAGL